MNHLLFGGGGGAGIFLGKKLHCMFRKRIWPSDLKKNSRFEVKFQAPENEIVRALAWETFEKK